MFTQADKDFLLRKGITEEQINEQLEHFRQGFPYLQLEAAASVGKGILVPNDTDTENYLKAWEAYKQTDRKIVKFVPASGAASRMFKNMFAFLNAEYDVPQTDFEKDYFAHIHYFAF